MSDLYLSPRPQSLRLQSSLNPSSSASDSDTQDREKGNQHAHARTDEIPPWEKLTFPNFRLEERTASAVLGPGLGFVEAFIPKSRSRPSTPKSNLANSRNRNRSRRDSMSTRLEASKEGIIPPSFGRPRRLTIAGRTVRGHLRRPSTAPSASIGAERVKLQVEMLGPSLSVGSPGLRPPSPIPVYRLPNGRRLSQGISERNKPRSPPRTKLSPKHDQNSLKPPSNAAEMEIGISITISKVSTVTRYSSATHVDPDQAAGEGLILQKSGGLEKKPSLDEGKLHVTLLQRPSLSINSQASSRDCASFRGMLSPAFPPAPLPDQGCGESGKEGGKVETLASLMNRSASTFLIWFPLTVSYLLDSANLVLKYRPCNADGSV